MTQPLFGVFLTVLVFSVAVLVALAFGAHLYSVSELTGGAYGARLNTYADYNLGLSVRYPADFTVDDSYNYVGLGQDKYIQGISFSVPASKLKGTNLLPGTQASVEIIPNTPSCHVKLFLSDPSNIRSFIDGDVLYSSGMHKSENSKSEYEEQVYAITGSSPCVAIRYLIRTEPITSYNAASLASYNRKDLLSVFDTMRHSLVVQK
ncbi:hypothetical protein K2X83_01510 [Patescibacteria group bacterium]|nr:hypothetical protein [Patescibacteria group bacterium]